MRHCRGYRASGVIVPSPGEADQQLRRVFSHQGRHRPCEQMVEAPESAVSPVPHALLEAAGIPLDDDLDIHCEDGAIIIGSADLVRYRCPSSWSCSTPRRSRRYHPLWGWREVRRMKNKPIYKLMDSKGRVLIQGAAHRRWHGLRRYCAARCIQRYGQCAKGGHYRNRRPVPGGGGGLCSCRFQDHAG